MHKLIIFIFTALFSTLTLADPVWIDVRSIEEYQQDHIQGDLRIDFEKIVTEIKKAYPDKSQEIQLYCRSGRRAGIAMNALKESGYNNVLNAGGINEVRKLRVKNSSDDSHD